MSITSETKRSEHTQGRRGTSRLLRINRLRLGNWLGVFLLAIVIIVAVGAPWLAPYDPSATDSGATLQPMLSKGHLLGTDQIGRDILSRLIYGARFALFVAVTPT